jgi:Coenzyme PQQ synthesis protein D (PqqD)
MIPINGGSVLKQRADVRFRVIDDEGVVVRQSAAEVLVLNEIATRLLAAADGATPVAAWVDALAADYDVGRAELERDVVAFAAELVEQGLLEVQPAAPAGAAERPLTVEQAAGQPRETR